MRLLHLADLHIGKRVNEFPMLEDQRFVLGQALDLVRERGVDALLLAGDLYDKSLPSAEAVALLDWFLGEAAATGARVLAVSGNHDSAERVAYASGLLAHQGIHLSPVYDGTIAHCTLEDEYGPVTFWLLPFLKPADVRRFFPDAEIASYTDALRCAIEACGVDTTRRNVALAHQFVTSGGKEPERCDSETVSVGGLDNVDAGVFDAFDYVALGHIHGPQRVGRDEVRYAGSPLKYSVSEASHRKSAPLVELGPKGEVSVELVELKPLHDLRHPRGTLEQLVSPEAVAAGDPEDYIFATLTDEQTVPDALGRLRSVFPNVMGIDYDNARTRAAGALGRTPAAQRRDPLSLFEEFYELQNGKPLSDAQRSCVIGELSKVEAM